MRFFLFLLIASSALAQSEPRAQISHTTESLRGVSAVSREVAWASGTHGTYLRTVDGGRTWTPAQVPDAGALDFRGVAGLSADEAFLMSAGPGEQSRIYHTADGGKHWQLQFTNKDPKGFFDSIAFWDAKHGIVLGDPIADASGTLKFEVLVTEDGANWHAAGKPFTTGDTGEHRGVMPAAMEGEGAFAASNTCIAISGSDVWFATGGKVARVFHSGDFGKSWQVFDTPIVHGPESAGIFSVAFRDAAHGVIAGGDYKRPNDDGPNLAFTEDGGKTWRLSEAHPLVYFSGAAYERGATSGKKTEGGGERLFLAGQDFMFDFRPPSSLGRSDVKNKLGIGLNAVSAFPEGGALMVGPKGSIAVMP